MKSHIENVYTSAQSLRASKSYQHLTKEVKQLATYIRTIVSYCCPIKDSSWPSYFAHTMKLFLVYLMIQVLQLEGNKNEEVAG